MVLKRITPEEFLVIAKSVELKDDCSKNDITKWAGKIAALSVEYQFEADQKEYDEREKYWRQAIRDIKVLKDAMDIEVNAIDEAHNAVIKSLFEEIETPLEFAVKIAKVMDDLRSSHVFFIIQQALGDMDWEEAQGIFGTVIKNAENIEALKQKYGGEDSPDYKRITEAILDEDQLSRMPDQAEKWKHTLQRVVKKLDFLLQTSPYKGITLRRSVGILAEELQKEANSE